MGNYRGIPKVEFIWNGSWSDPQLKYKGHLFNYWDIEDTLFYEYAENFAKNIETDDDDELFTLWLRANKDKLYNLLNEMMIN